MKRNLCLVVAAILLATLSTGAVADSRDEVRLKHGEMPLAFFLEMISDKLDLEIDASSLGSSSSRGLVTVPDAGAVNLERARAVALTVLHLEGYTWIQDPPTGVYRVLRQRDARDQEIPFVTEAKDLPDSDLMVTYLLSIRHTSPEYVARNLRSFMPANSRIIPDTATNAVLITDSARNIAKLGKLVERMDTPGAAKQAKEWIEKRAKDAVSDCPESGTAASGPSGTMLIVLFSLIALVIGFLTRGYVIRRIEGGL